MFAASEQQILLRAMSACPKGIPLSVQQKTRQALSNSNQTTQSTISGQNESVAQTTTSSSSLPTISDTPFELANPSLQELMQGTPFQWKK